MGSTLSARDESEIDLLHNHGKNSEKQVLNLMKAFYVKY